MSLETIAHTAIARTLRDACAEETVDLDAVTELLRQYRPQASLFRPYGWAETLDLLLEEIGRPAGILRRLTAGLRSLAARRDAHTTWRHDPHSREGDVAHMTLHAVSLAGEWSRRAWWAQAEITIHTRPDGEVVHHPASSGRFLVGNEAGEVTEFRGRIVADWLASVWKDRAARTALRAAAQLPERDDDGPDALEETSFRAALASRTEDPDPEDTPADQNTLWDLIAEGRRARIQEAQLPEGMWSQLDDDLEVTLFRHDDRNVVRRRPVPDDSQGLTTADIQRAAEAWAAEPDRSTPPLTIRL